MWAEICGRKYLDRYIWCAVGPESRAQNASDSTLERVRVAEGIRSCRRTGFVGAVESDRALAHNLPTVAPIGRALFDRPMSRSSCAGGLEDELGRERIRLTTVKPVRNAISGSRRSEWSRINPRSVRKG